MALEFGDVRCWKNSGKHMLAVSFSAFNALGRLGCLAPRRLRLEPEHFLA
jgi:hypothetical protein